MVATFQTAMVGKRDLKQVKVVVDDTRVPSDVSLFMLLPIALPGALGGTPMGLLLGLTYPDSEVQPRDAQPNDTDCVVVRRIIPSQTASADVTFQSVQQDGTVRAVSPTFSVTEPNEPQADGDIPIFIGGPGDLLMVKCDVACTFGLILEVIPRHQGAF